MRLKKHLHPHSLPRQPLHLLGLALPIALAFTGLYLLAITLAPVYLADAPSAVFAYNWDQPVPKAQLRYNRLYIPRLSLNITYQHGDQTVLQDGLWHRYPNHGNPSQGGNFILAGHRFVMGWTPEGTKRQSPLYYINKIQHGDFIYADFNGVRYLYKVTAIQRVAPNQSRIETPSIHPTLTLYTCTLKGQTDGREVVQAELIKKNVDPQVPLALNAKH